jgi:GR25 family glycosyltransferase involved in LPS biosynthesis
MNSTSNLDNLINTYFDRIFIINLKRRPDRKEQMIKKMEKNGITNYEFIEAIDGKNEECLKAYHQRLQKGFFEGPCAFGVLYSAMKVLIWSKAKKYNRILILEDDVIFHQEFTKRFNLQVNKIPPWKLLYFGTSMENFRLDDIEKINNGFVRSKGTIAGAFGIGIDKSIFDELMYYIKNTVAPWDIGPLKIINEKYHSNVIIFYPYLVIAQTNDSNIRAGISIEEKSKKCGWDLLSYEI